MGTAVSSSITKSGSTITGNITQIIVVITAPADAPNPGHPGTGTIIATHCPYSPSNRAGRIPTT